MLLRYSVAIFKENATKFRNVFSLGRGPESIAAFPRENTRIGAADMPCHGEPPGFTPRAISHNRQNRKFSACRALKKAAENQFYQELPRPILKTETRSCCP